MKELSIEEKAKAYDEAVNEIRNLRDMLLEEGVINKDGVICDNFNRIFPELKESEDEKVRKEIVTYLKSVIANKGYRDKIIESWIAWLEKQGEQEPADVRTTGYWHVEDVEQNPAWSEEDDIMVHDIDYALRCQITYPISRLQSMSTWIDNLKDRVQPKQEWSEQEQVRINRIVACLENLNVADNDILLKDVDWLKSLRPQNTWKPSDEQMKALWDSIPENVKEISEREMLLDSLYQDLKKLREE